jgi:hypothetical protein
MANDQLGVQMIYPSKVNGESWIIDTTPMSDGRVDIYGDGGTITYRSSTEDYKISQNDNVRIGITTSAGFSQTDVTTNHNTLKERGFYMSEKDWKNVEITIYFKYDGTSDTVLALYTRTARHFSDRKCEGFSYKSTFNLKTGKVRFVKEQYHVNQSSTPEKVTAVTNPKDKWVGFKFVIFNINSNTNVRGETYIDANETNTWVKVDEFVDSGGWGSQAGACQKTTGTNSADGGPDYIGIHGGPYIFYKWEGGNGDVIFKKLSIREIDITLLGGSNPDPDPDPDPDPPPGSTDPPPVEEPITGAVFANLIGVYNINFNESDGCSGLLVDVPPLQVLFTVPKTHDITLDHNRDHVGLIAHDNSVQNNNVNDKSQLIGKKIRRVDMIMSKYGGAIGTATLYIKKNSGNDIVTTFGSIDVTTLPQGDTVVYFEDLNNSHRMSKDDRLVLVYTEGSAQTYLKVGINQSDPYDGARTCLVRREPNPSSHYVEDLTYDLACTVYI